MKNYIFYLCLAMLLMSTYGLSQDQERKSQFYLQYGFMSVGDQSKVFVEKYYLAYPIGWSRPVFDIYQRTVKRDLNFYNTRSLGVGILKRLKLKQNLYLRYGAGIDLMAFSLSRDYNDINRQLIDRVNYLDNGQKTEVVIEHISDPIETYDSFYDYVYDRIGSVEQIAIFSLNLPLEMQYFILDRLSISGGLIT